MTKANDLRMPFSEWLYRMSESAVPYQARALAVYAVAFRATSNEELACLVGMDTKGVADKTYNKWKRYLSDNGWVIVRQVTIGRVTTIEVDPAFQTTPVNFTDMKPREPRKFYGSSSATITDTPAVASTTEPEKVTAPEVKTTAVPCARARIEPPSGVNISLKKQTTTSPPESEAGSGGCDFSALNGSAVDLIDFIAQHASTDKQSAARMLQTNIRAFTADILLEAFSVTIAEMATGMVATPYKYLMATAQKMKARAKTKAAKQDDDAEEKAAAKAKWERQVIEDALREKSR